MAWRPIWPKWYVFEGHWEKFKEVDHLNQTSAGDLFGLARSIVRFIWPYTGNQVKLLVQCLYSFPIVATTNYYNLSNTNLSYSSGGQKSKMGQQDCIALEALGENRLSCLYWFVEAPHIPWHTASFFVFKASSIASSHL